MLNKETLAARYADLLSEQDHPDLLALVGDLDAVYSAPEPPEHLTLAGALARRERASESRQQRRWLPRFQLAQRFPRRVGVVAAALALAVVMLTGSVFAYPLVKQLFDPDPGLQQVVQNPLLYQDINASQTVDGFTLTVQKAYADANRIILSYTLTRADDPHYNVSYQPILTTQDGTALRAREFFISLAGGVPQPQFTAFDADAITGTPPELHLRLTMDGKVASEPVDPSQRSPLLTQPISVDFSVPFHAGRVVNLHQAVTVNGKTLILERVVVTPSETRVYLRGDGYPLALDSIPTLNVGNWSSSQLSSNGGPSPAVDIWPTDDQFPTNAMVAVNFETSLMNQHGTWTLVVSTLLNPPYDGQSAGTAGPWTFHFVVP